MFQTLLPIFQTSPRIADLSAQQIIVGSNLCFIWVWLTQQSSICIRPDEIEALDETETRVSMPSDALPAFQELRHNKAPKWVKVNYSAQTWSDRFAIVTQHWYMTCGFLGHFHFRERIIIECAVYLGCDIQAVCYLKFAVLIELHLLCIIDENSL